MSRIRQNDLVKPREMTREYVPFAIGVIVRKPYEASFVIEKRHVQITYRVDVYANGKIYAAILVGDLEKISCK